jgi:hypothetical protein
MTGLVGIIALLAVLGLSLVITRVATIALSSTGLSEEAARFQARSAFTGTGFTTSEAEAVVNHPVRRRIIMILMVLRSAGLVTIIITLILSFVDSGDGGLNRIIRLAILAGGVGGLWLLSRSRTVDKFVSKLIKKALKKWTDLDVQDYVGLLRLSGQYTVTELKIEEDDWIEGKKLSQCYLRDEGVTVLGITRKDGTYIGGPNGDSEIFAGDTLILYGKAETLSDLDKRRNDIQGQHSHDRAVERHKQSQEHEQRKDQEYTRKERNKAAKRNSKKSQ